MLTSKSFAHRWNFFLCGNTKWCVKITITVHKMIVTRTCSFNSVLSWRCETLWDGEALWTFQMALRNRREVAVQSLGINSRWLWSVIGSDGSEGANSDCKAAPLWPWGFAYERKQTIRRVWSVSPLLLAEKGNLSPRWTILIHMRGRRPYRRIHLQVKLSHLCSKQSRSTWLITWLSRPVLLIKHRRSVLFFLEIGP